MLFFDFTVASRHFVSVWLHHIATVHKYVPIVLYIELFFDYNFLIVLIYGVIWLSAGDDFLSCDFYII